LLSPEREFTRNGVKIYNEKETMERSGRGKSKIW
jgi:hypothetical protein